MASVDIAQYTDTEVARFKSDLIDSLRRLSVELRSRLDRVKRDENGKIDPSDAENIAILQAVGDNLARDFAEIFNQQAPQRWREASARVVREVQADLSSQGVPDQFTTAAVETLRAHVNGVADAVASIAGDGAAELRQVIREMALSVVSPADLVDALQSRLDASLAQALTLVDTGVMGLDRQVVVTQATEAGFEWFLYDGPVDQLTRPFCDERVGKLFHVTEMDETPNDTGPQPPSTYAGGYNCRHRWVAVDAVSRTQYPRWQDRSYEVPQ